MPVLTTALPPQAVEVRSLWDVEETAVSQGLEGRQVREEIENVSQHWRQQPLVALVIAPSDLPDQMSSYRHPPFERAGTRRVRYVGIRDLTPRHIECDFDEDTNG
ncbi:MAG: hypothetical protein J5I93_30390 [Pirellulaceae bacterium]|nr:hypothetical protein [Pirellulaceae bacterium]